MSDTWQNQLTPVQSEGPAPSWRDQLAPVQSTTQQKAVLSADSNGEEAARALAVSKKTGIPATVVQSDLLGYDAHARQQSAIKASQNPALAKYIDGNQMASKVSADDYDHLQEVSETLAALHPELVRGKASGGVLAGIPEVGNLLASAPGREKLFNALKELPAALGQGLLDFVQTPGKVKTGEINLTTPQGLEQGISFGLGVALGSRDIRVGRAPEGGVASTADVDAFLAKVRGAKTRQEINDFLASKQEGPPGAMLQIEHAKAGGEALDKAVEVAQASKTKARSPELFEEAAAAHDPGNVHIDATKIVELYQQAGKVPAEGDGLFGFVPDIAAKAQAAAATGGEVTIPVAKYIAHVDPTVHEGLKESVRLHDDGVTLEEAKEHEKAIEAWHGTPHDFEQFDLTKIGTGEGAQSYGHGLYFAENKGVANNYAERLATTTIEGKSFDEKNPQHKLTDYYYNTYNQNRAELTAVIRADVEHMEQSKLPGDKKQLAVYKEILATLESGKQIPNFDENKGQLYKVSINADPTHFLDWDKPLSEQAPEIQAVIKKLDLEYGPFNDENIQGIYRTIGSRAKIGTDLAPDAAASKALAEAGIPGIKYLDQGSRTPRKSWIDDDGKYYVGRADGGRVPEAGPFETSAEAQAALKSMDPGTRNFVVFDDRLVKITEKNGEPVAAAVEAQAEVEKQALGLDTRVFMNMLSKDQKALNITPAEFKQYSDLIARQEQAVLDRAVKVSKAEIARALTPEWKRNEAAVRTEVTEEFQTQGVFAAERYLRQNKIELGGDNIGPIADELAPLWGFESGDALRRALTDLETVQAADRKSVQVQEREAIKAEVAARMEERYGDLAENIAKEARQIALADHTFDVLAAEVRILANAAGVTPPLSRAEMVDWAKRSFESSNAVEAANWEKHRRAVERGRREAEKALLKGDFLEAFQAKQRQMLAATIAKESFAFQKVVDSAERKIDRFSSEEVIKSIDQAHLEQIRQMLASIGLPQQFAPLAGTESLRTFVDQSQGQIAAAPWLMDGTQPKLQDMSVEQFRDFVKSMQSVEHVGRDAKKLHNSQGEAELENVVRDAVISLERFPFIDQPSINKSITQKAQSFGRKVLGMHLLVERVLDYTDQFNPHGPLTEWLDRPLRDANSKEIALTEMVVREMKELQQYNNKSILELIPNKLITDRNAKSGFLQMTRFNLRMLMANMGNWSNIAKAVEGFDVNEADLRRFVAENAKPADVAWVNGIWKIFEKLKPEMDAVELRDAGVPVDKIEPVSWDLGAGKKKYNEPMVLNGGYFPLNFDPRNSNITTKKTRPLFDSGYRQTATSHGWTEERTAYKGAIDLSGTFLSSKIQSMVHDISFREAVRNANKLIEHEDFKAAMEQHWGVEIADLLPGWLRDIANSHNLDDAYAKGFVYASAIIRQNVTQTLIAYNPNTVIKHGFTAAVMSADRVGLGNLLEASKDIGLKGAAKGLKDLVKHDKRIPDEAFMEAFRDLLDNGERAENVRQFILDSSPVMRNRMRQWEDSIRGATDSITKIGITQTAANFRQRQMQYGRLAVAFSDQLSAMPTWYATYKKAYTSGESHADAVFIADKDVSRAHGSSFVGDQPMVTRLGNTGTAEIVKYFVALYKFWNHQVNNNVQLVWDAAAYVRGPAAYEPMQNRPPPIPGGPPPPLPPPNVHDFSKDSSGDWRYSQEPGAKAGRIAYRLAQMIAIIWIEESATAAKDESGHGFGARFGLALMRYLGAQSPFTRDITHGFANGYEPTTGLMGTIYKEATNTARDIGQAAGVKAGVAKNAIIHTATIIGFMTGALGSQVGRTTQGLTRYFQGKETPRNLASDPTLKDWRQLFSTGSTKARKH